MKRYYLASLQEEKSRGRGRGSRKTRLEGYGWVTRMLAAAALIGPRTVTASSRGRVRVVRNPLNARFEGPFAYQWREPRELCQKRRPWGIGVSRLKQDLVAGLGELPPGCGWPASSSSLSNLSVIEPSAGEVDRPRVYAIRISWWVGEVLVCWWTLSRRGQEAKRGVPYQDDKKICLGLVNVNDILVEGR
ncbi:hypothetical protein CRG98_009131 [Punica granatum]|uniref:Uncharacterized protein n=1 Tax=Punica granatum TaxID=22663 RepID=A0A2I0KPP5_PUNGR|nr:hypothetical protein CRG98_009131 [Punica granatum]